MAEALVNVLLERLGTIALDKFGEEFKLVTGVEKEVENLTRKLAAIKDVLEDAEQRQVMEASVRRWLSELTEISFEMDDVLDEWVTEVLKRQMEKQEQQGENAQVVATKKKVCLPCLSSCFCFGQVNQFMLRRDIAVRIQQLNEEIDLIDQNKQSFNFQTTTGAVPELPQRSKSTSLPLSKPFGREFENKFIISKLLSESSEEKEVPLIIPIVGMGGTGKTTLAQLVYNDENVKSHFDKRIWVCVSDPFEEIKIAKAIIEGLDRNNTSKNSNELQTLVQCIYELLERTRFLLVLDDVWNPTCSQWEELIKPLHNGAMGSRVLVTTRNENIATFMKATTQKILLKGLNEEFCLSLFYYSADMDESCVSKEFKDIGLEIVRRCNGLPLAAKTLGSLMRNKKTIHAWQAVLNSKTWELKEVQQDVFRPLLLSYHDLTLATKRCLLYCGIFPKDHVYDKNRLIELWMSQDYLNIKGSNEEMIVGQSYFHDLVMRSFFQDVEVNDKNGNITCKIHDFVHDFLQYLSKNECMILNSELNDSNKKEVPSDNVHHLTIVNPKHSDYLVHYLLNCKRLRTFTAIDLYGRTLGALFELMVQLKCLRTITLRPRGTSDTYPIKIPESIGGLIHLRCLDLSGGDYMEELPSAIGSLYNLQTLRLVGCESLRKVDVGRLINLRHLYVQGCFALIKGIERLTQLQRLDWFRVGSGDERNKLEDLKDLNQLQGSLTIYMEGNPKMAENAAILVNKPHLLELKLKFNRSWSQGHVEVMNGLEPHPGLNSLYIGGYVGGVFSDWLWSLHSLRFLTLEHCRLCKSFPPLGKLASLESLSIRILDGVSKVGVEFLGIGGGQTSSSYIFTSFPKLKKLTIDYTESWEEWEGVEMGKSDSITVMPCLSELTIKGCWNLEALPDFLWKTPLRKLHISESPILQNLYREETGEQWPKISHIPNIKLINVEELQLINVEELLDLP